MLLFSKLFKRQSNQTPNEPAPAEGSLSLAAQIPDNYLPLWQLYKQRQLLEVKLDGASRSYQTMILAMDIERGLIWFDDLFPQQLLLETGDPVCVRHHQGSESLSVHGAVIALGADYGATGFALLLPEAASYQPRRTDPRFTLNGDTPTLVKLRTLGAEPCIGTLQDISAGGMKLHVAGNMLAQLRHGTLLPLLEFKLENQLQIRCRAKVCAFRFTRAPYRCTQISLEFVDLDEEKRNQLTKFLRYPDDNINNEFRAA